MYIVELNKHTILNRHKTINVEADDFEMKKGEAENWTYFYQDSEIMYAIKTKDIYSIYTIKDYKRINVYDTW